MKNEDHQNVKIVLKYLEHASTQDFKGAASVLTDDVSYKVPGQSLTAQDTRGPDGVFQAFGKLMLLSNGTYKITEMVDWLVSDSRCLLIAKEEAIRNGKTFSWLRLVLFQFKDEKISNIQIFDEDQKSYDQFWS